MLWIFESGDFFCGSPDMLLKSLRHDCFGWLNLWSLALSILYSQHENQTSQWAYQYSLGLAGIILKLRTIDWFWDKGAVIKYLLYGGGRYLDGPWKILPWLFGAMKNNQMYFMVHKTFIIKCYFWSLATAANNAKIVSCYFFPFDTCFSVHFFSFPSRLV